ncbi:hypothetical protein INR49_023075 [Caranx melampygus]|nr:hypothetical protein INR49_023075 [Caranx melampygus]
MCQVEEDYQDGLERTEVPSVSKKCVKCKEASAAVGLSQNAHKKLRFLPGIIYIDEGGAVGQSVEERQRKVAELQVVFRATGIPFNMVPLEQSDGSSSLTPQDQEQTSLPEVQESHTQLLQQLISSAKTLTARQDLLSTLRHHLLVHTARTEGYSKVMLGDNCTRVAVKLLTSISLGRGAQLAQDTGFSDSRYGDIILVRPMRDYSAKEIAYYNHMFRVPSVFIPGLDTKTTDKASIQRLTESFVTKLQADFPSTVSTIYRTSEKLQTACKNSSTAEQADRCLLCMCALDTAVENASAFQSTLTSEQLSQRKSSAATTETPRPNPAPAEQGSTTPTGQCCSSGGGEDCERAERGGGGCCSVAKEPECTDLKRLLCYSCQLTIKDMVSGNTGTS